MCIDLPSDCNSLDFWAHDNVRIVSVRQVGKCEEEEEEVGAKEEETGATDEDAKATGKEEGTTGEEEGQTNGDVITTGEE